MTIIFHKFLFINKKIYMRLGVRVSGFNFWVVRGPTLVLFLFYVNVSGVCRRFRLFTQPLTIPVPSVFLRVEWSLPMVVPWVTA